MRDRKGKKNGYLMLFSTWGDNKMNPATLLASQRRVLCIVLQDSHVLPSGKHKKMKIEEQDRRAGGEEENTAKCLERGALAVFGGGWCVVVKVVPACVSFCIIIPPFPRSTQGTR